MRTVTTLTGALLLALGAAAPVPAAAASAGPAPARLAADDAADGSLLLMLDASGSMKDKDPSGVSKMDAAKKALGTVVDGLPAGAKVGLRVYGATQPGGAPTPAACRDTQLVTPIGPADKNALKSAIARFTPKGETPIAYSLAEALKDLGPSGKRNIVLVSDGEESCTPDPCPQIKQLVANGVDLRIDTVGFAVSDKARAQLQCLADAGHGTYYDAKDAAQLTTSVRKLSTRAFRPFSVAGKPVQGTTSPLDAPHLAAGQYTDSIPQTNGTRYYRIARRPGSTLRVAVTSRPATNADDYNRELWRYSLESLRGNTCSSESSSRFDTLGFNDLINAALTVGPTDSSCAKETDLVLKIQRPAGGQAATPTEIKVMEEASVANIDALPTGATERPAPLRPPVTAARPVVGGTSFNDAQAIGSGTYVADIAPGEMAFFKTRLDFGQKATFAVDGPTEQFTQWPDDYSVLWIDGDAWSPAREHYRPAHNHGMFKKTELDDDQVLALPTVAYRNRQATDSDVRVASTSGDYYFTVVVGAKDVGAKVQGSVPVKFSLLVDGARTGAPTYQPLGQAAPTELVTGSPTAEPTTSAASPSTSSASTATPTTSPTTSPAPTVAATEASSSSGGVPTIVWVLGGLAAAAAAIGGGVAAGLRRRPGA